MRIFDEGTMMLIDREDCHIGGIGYTVLPPEEGMEGYIGVELTTQGRELFTERFPDFVWLLGDDLNWQMWLVDDIDEISDEGEICLQIRKGVCDEATNKV